MAGIARDGSTPQERQERRRQQRTKTQPWQPYVPVFSESGDPERPIHMEFRGPSDGTHDAGNFNSSELITSAVMMIQEAQKAAKIAA